MRKHTYLVYLLILVLSLVATLATAGIMPKLVAGRYWVDADHPRLEEMDPLILERLSELGIVQQLREWPDSPIQEATTMTLIRAPIDRVWEVLLDIENRPRLLPEIYTDCRIVERKSKGSGGPKGSGEPDELITAESLRVSVPPFSWDLEVVNLYRIDRQNSKVDFEVISGNLKGSKGRLTLIPSSNEEATIVFFRHYLGMRNIDWKASLFLKFSPQFSIPANIGEGVALIRGVRREAEDGLNRPYRKPAPWNQVDLDILDAMSEHRLYIHQEKEDGDPLCTTSAWKIQAPVNEVWKVVTDFEQWDKYQSQMGVKNRILSRQENQVKLVQELSYKVFYIFGVNLEIEYEYNLSPPDRIMFHSPDPNYPGTHGEWNLRATDEGGCTYLVLSANIYIQKAMGVLEMLGEVENPMPVRETHNMMGVQTLGAPVAEEIAKNREGGQ